MFLLQIEAKNGSPRLEGVLKLLVQVKRRLYLHERAKFWWVVLNVNSAEFVLCDICVQTGHRNVVDPYICIVSSAQPNLINIVKVDNVKLFLTFMVLFRGVNLEWFDNNVILRWLLDFKDLMCSFTVFEVIFQLRLTKFTMESFPCVWCDVWCYFFVLVSTKPLSEAL